MTVISTSEIKMQEKGKGLNNRGFEWMLNSESNQKQEKKIFNFNFQKSISFFSSEFRFSVSFTGSKNSGENECTD